MIEMVALGEEKADACAINVARRMEQYLMVQGLSRGDWMIGGGNKGRRREILCMTDEVGTTSKISEYFLETSCFKKSSTTNSSFLNEIIFKKFRKVYYEI